MEEADEYIKLPSSPPEEIYCHDNNQNLEENTNQNRDGDAQADGGATFVLASKGTWWHAGFHLTTAIVGPAILTLPYAFRCMGWTLGVFSLSLAAAVSFYAYFLMSQVLDHCEKNGRRHIRFRELASDVLGYGWMFYLVVSVQTVINTGICVGCILLGAECLEVMYADIDPDGNLNLHHFILIVAAVMVVMAQLPSFHSLRHINFVSLFLSLGYSFCIAVACILAGNSSEEPKDYSLPGSKVSRVFNTFQAMSLMGTTFGNGILPEIQATLAPPARGKMLKGLCMCYGVIVVTFYSVAVSGYWAFGSNSKDNILENLMSDDSGVAVVPLCLLVISVIFIILQIFAIALVYSQVAYEILEKKSADVRMGVFSWRNLLPRLILRSLYVIFCAFIAAMLPFFGDLNALVGAVGFVPLDFILPMLLYNMSFKPPRVSAIWWVNSFIMVIFTGVGIVGAISAVRQIVIDAKLFKLFSTTVID